jgi:hypothetical protein
MYINAQSFAEPEARLRAAGHDTRPASAVIDHQGKVLFHPRTGGIESPRRHELKRGEVIFRFAGGRSPLCNAITGNWWTEETEFRKLVSFAGDKGVSVAMAARLLCCVPPEWNDMGLLLRARVDEPLLAYRGLPRDVQFQHDDGLGTVRARAHNHIASRRLYQLYIPGLEEVASVRTSRVLPGALHLEQTYKLDTEAAKRGWIYL